MSFQEQAAEQGVPAWVVFGLSLFFVFLILAALYESWTLPFSVLLSTPVAILGAYLAHRHALARERHLRHHRPHHAHRPLREERHPDRRVRRHQLQAGPSIAEAALDAARLRFRPIVMTAFAFIFGCLPLWTASGSGAVSRRILGTVVIGGMVLATFIGILLIPVTFSVVEYLSHRFRRGGKGTTMDSKHDADPKASPPRPPSTQDLTTTFTPLLTATTEVPPDAPRLVTQLLAALALTLALTGCTVGPKYTRPNVPAPPAFRGADNADVSSDPKTPSATSNGPPSSTSPSSRTSSTPRSPNNYDLRIAAQHILEQQQQVRITRSQQFPQVNAVLSGAGTNISAAGTTVLTSPPVEFGLSASWTPDFWGLYRKQTEAQRDQLLAQQWAQRAVRVTLVQQVATTYFQLRALDAAARHLATGHPQSPPGLARSHPDARDRRRRSAL